MSPEFLVATANAGASRLNEGEYGMVFYLKTPLSLDTAERIVEGVFAEGKAREFEPLTAVVLDIGGHAIALKRQDGCGIMRGDVALGKAWGALGMGIPSGTLGKMFAQNPNFVSGLVGASDGKFAPNPGGVLILDADGAVTGAVGVSGDVGPNDEICAIAGVKAAGLRAEGTAE